MKDIETAFLDGEISYDEMQRAFDRAAEAQEVIARGGNQLSDGSYVKRYTMVIGEDGTGTAELDNA